MLPAAGYTPVSSKLALGLSSLGTTAMNSPVAFLGRTDRFTFMSTDDGTGLCEYPAGGGGTEFSVSPVVSPSGLVITGTRATLYAFNSKSQSCLPLWTHSAGVDGAFSYDALNLVRSTLVFSVSYPSGYNLGAIDSLTGQPLGSWVPSNSLTFSAGPLVLSSDLPQVVVSSGASVWCLLVPSFASAWPAGPATLPGATALLLGAGAKQSGSPVLVFVTATKVLYSLSSTDGSQIWSRNFGSDVGPFGSPVAPAGSCSTTGTCLVLMTVGSQLRAIDAASGNVVWSVGASGGGQLSLCAVGSNGFSFAASPEGLYGFSLQGEQSYLITTLAAPLSCALAGSKLFAVQPSNQNANLLALSTPPTPPVPSAAAVTSVAIVAGVSVGAVVLAAIGALLAMPALRAALWRPTVRRFRRVRGRRGGARDDGSLNAPLLP